MEPVPEEATEEAATTETAATTQAAATTEEAATSEAVPEAVTAMSAAAKPFVPDPSPPGRTQQGASDSSGVEVDTGGMSGTTVWRPQYKGRIRSFSDQKGFGFIDCADTLRAFGRDVFIHRFQMAETDLKVGQEVLFEVELNKQGHPQGRRVRPNEEAMTWDMSQMGGDYDGYGMGAAYGGGGGMYGGGGGMYGGGNMNYYHQPRERYAAPDQSMMMGMNGDQGLEIEEMLRACSGSSDMWEIIEQYGHSFGKKHVVTALYQLGLCRQYEKRNAEVNLTSALVDRLVLFSPNELTADEASRVLWALAVLDEVSGHSSAHRFAVQLGEQAAKRFAEFTPAQMAGFVSSLSRLVRDPSEDELVGRITTQFSDYALGGTGALPRFAPHELSTWTNFLKEAAASERPGGHGGAPPYPFMGGKGMPGGPFGQPGSYSGPGGGMMPPWAGPQMGKGMPGMPPMGKGPMQGGPGGPGGFPGKGGGGKEAWAGLVDAYGKGFDPYGKGGKPGGFDAYGPGPGGKGPPMGGGGPGPGGPGPGGPGPGGGPGKGFGMPSGPNPMGPGGKPGGKGPMGAFPGGGKGPGGDMPGMPGGPGPGNYSQLQYSKGGGPPQGPGPMGGRQPGPVGPGGFGGSGMPMGGVPPGQQQRGGGGGAPGGGQPGPGPGTSASGRQGIRNQPHQPQARREDPPN